MSFHRRVLHNNNNNNIYTRRHKNRIRFKLFLEIISTTLQSVVFRCLIQTTGLSRTDPSYTFIRLPLQNTLPPRQQSTPVVRPSVESNSHERIYNRARARAVDFEQATAILRSRNSPQTVQMTLLSFPASRCWRRLLYNAGESIARKHVNEIDRLLFRRHRLFSATAADWWSASLTRRYWFFKQIVLRSWSFNALSFSTYARWIAHFKQPLCL